MLASHAMLEAARKRGGVDLSRLLVALLLILCLAKVCLLFVLAVNSRYATDEYGQAEYSRYLGDFYQQFDPIKNVLYAYFFQLAHGLSDDSVELMLTARLQGFALALGMIALCYSISRRLGAGRSASLFSVFVLLSFSTFMERAFRVRADTLAVFLALAGLWVALGADGKPIKWRGLARWLHAFGAGLLVGAAFLSTQKAAYHALALGLGYLVVGIRSAWTRESPRLRATGTILAPAAVFSSGWAASVLLYAVYFGGTDFPRTLKVVFTAPLRIALHGDEAYQDLWIFVYQTLTRNQLAYGLCFIGLALAVFRFRRLAPRQLLALTVGSVLTVLVLRHNQPWPYVFVLLIPFLAPWSTEVVHGLRPRARKPELDGDGQGLERRQTVALLLLAGALALSFPRNFFVLRYDNLAQDRVASKAEAMLGSQDSYADGVGMIPTRHRAGDRWWWDAATQIEIRRAALRGDFTAVQETFDDRPKLWIINYRVQALEPLLGPRLEASYVRVDPNILLAGTRLVTGAEREFVAMWPGPYRLYGVDGRPLDLPFQVDGREVRGEIPIAAGPHLVQFAGPTPGEAFLLPDGLELTGPLPATLPPRPLFSQVYQ